MAEYRNVSKQQSPRAVRGAGLIVLIIGGVVLVVLSVVLERIHAGEHNNLKDP